MLRNYTNYTNEDSLIEIEFVDAFYILVSKRILLIHLKPFFLRLLRYDEGDRNFLGKSYHTTYISYSRTHIIHILLMRII